MTANSSGAAHQLSGARVRDHMTRAVITITPAESCERALSIMQTSHIKHLPVLEGKRLVGILAERDIRRRLARIRAAGHSNESKLLSLVKVGGVMTYAPATVDPSVPLGEAAAIMLERRISSLPVVRRGRLVGIFTTRDAIGLLAAYGSGGRTGAPEDEPAAPAPARKRRLSPLSERVGPCLPATRGHGTRRSDGR